MSVTGLLWPRYEDTVFTIGRIPRLGEIATMLWLLVMGAKERTAKAPVG